MNTLSGQYDAYKPQSTMRTVGNALAGFGAGLQGRGQEFAAGMDAQRQQLSQQRMQAMAQDALQVYQLLEAGDPDSALQLVNRRVEAINKLGGNPSDTLDIQQKIASARFDEAKEDLGMFLSAAQQAGLIQAPKAAEEFTLSPGEVRYRGNEMIASAPNAPAELPAPSTDIGRLRRDFEYGYIDQQQFDALSRQATAQPIPTPLEQVQLRRAEVELANAEQAGEAKTAEATERDIMINNELIRAYELANNLRNRPGLSGAVGPIQGRMPVFDPAKADARADLKELGNLLTMANLGRMTGVLSESDIKLISSAASGLDELASDERAIAKLNEIVARLGSNPRVAEYLSRASGPEQPVSEGTVIVNPQTGERLVMRNGSWGPI